MTLHAPATTRSALRLVSRRFISSRKLWGSAAALGMVAFLPASVGGSRAEIPAGTGQTMYQGSSLSAPMLGEGLRAPSLPVAYAVAPSILSDTDYMTGDAFEIAGLTNDINIGLPVPTQRRAPQLTSPDFGADDYSSIGDIFDTVNHSADEPILARIEVTSPEKLSDILKDQGLSSDSVNSTVVALRADEIEDKRIKGDVIDLAMRDTEGARELFAIRLNLAAKDRLVELNWSDEDTSPLWHKLTQPKQPEEQYNFRPVSSEDILGEKVVKSVLVQGRIRTGFNEAVDRAGLTPGEKKTLIDLFKHKIDFKRDIRTGDRFEVLFEKKDNNDYGHILYASMVVRGKTTTLYRAENKNNEPEYFDADGKTSRRASIRRPLNSGRISSGYGMRRHPILGYRAMHRGIDFSAKTGTPILAAGHGVVEHVGRRGNYGKYIRIRHTNGYKTAYAHLSRYADGLKSGERVKQGDVIGYVGSTGLSTGPHLHYEVHKNGKAINPRKVTDLGPIEGIPANKKGSFEASVAMLTVTVANLREHAMASIRIEQ